MCTVRWLPAVREVTVIAGVLIQQGHLVLQIFGRVGVDLDLWQLVICVAIEVKIGDAVHGGHAKFSISGALRLWRLGSQIQVGT